MIRKMHAYLVKEVNLAENAEEKSAEFVNGVRQVTLEAFWTQKVKKEERFDRSDSMLEGLRAGWSAFFSAKIYPSLSRYLIKEIKEFLEVSIVELLARRSIVEVSIVELLALFVTFGAVNFVKGPAILLTEGVQSLRLDGLLTLIAITHGNLGGLMNLTRYPEQMRENRRKFDVKQATDSCNKIKYISRLWYFQTLRTEAMCPRPARPKES